MNEPLPVATRQAMLIGAVITEASRLGLSRADVRDVARKLERFAEDDASNMLLPLPAPCGRASVHELGGGQWWCRTCQRSFYGSGAEADAKGHG